jgi:hypothetical protein
MRRTLAVLATLALSGITAFAVAATPAGAVGSVNVTPSSAIADGTVVTVSWTGLQPNGTPSIVQCKDAPSSGASGADCVFATLQVSADGSNASGAGTDTFVVHDSNGLLALDSRTSVRCDTAHFGAILVVDNPNDPTSGSYKQISCSGSPPIVTPPHNLLSCTGTSLVATVNPALGSRNARYTKLAGKAAVAGASLEYGTNAPVPADATSCTVDTGIRNDNADTNSGTKLNPYDNQTAGQSPLTTAAPGKISLSLDGSASCQTVAQASAITSYPQAYPLQGKVALTFGQTSAGKPLTSQQYVRLDHNAVDPDPNHYAVTGIVIKGVGVGGTVSGTVRLFPTADPKKNLNVDECNNPDVNTSALTASIGQVSVSLADGPDQDATVDPWTVSIP